MMKRKGAIRALLLVPLLALPLASCGSDEGSTERTMLVMAADTAAIAPGELPETMRRSEEVLRARLAEFAVPSAGGAGTEQSARSRCATASLRVCLKRP